MWSIYGSFLGALIRTSWKFVAGLKIGFLFEKADKYGFLVCVANGLPRFRLMPQQKFSSQLLLLLCLPKEVTKKGHPCATAPRHRG